MTTFIHLNRCYGADCEQQGGGGGPPPVGEANIFVDASAPSDGAGTENDPFRFPQSGIEAASPGDIVELLGTFTHSHTVGLGTGRNQTTLVSSTVSGTEAEPIIIQAAAEGALIQGIFAAPSDSLLMTINGSWIRVHGIEFDQGILAAGSFSSDLFFTNVEIHDTVAPTGNYGMIRILGDSSVGPRRISILDVNLHDQWTCGPSSGTAACGASDDPEMWNTFSGASLTNGAAIFRQGVDVAGGAGGGEIWIRRALIERVPAFVTNKYSGPGSLTLIDDGDFDSSIIPGRDGNGTQPMTFENSPAFTNVQMACGACWDLP